MTPRGWQARHDDAFRQQVMLEKGRLIRDGLFDVHRAKAVFDDLIRRHPAAAMRSVWETEAGQCDILTGNPDAGLADFREALFGLAQAQQRRLGHASCLDGQSPDLRGTGLRPGHPAGPLAPQALNPDLFRSPLLNDGLDLKMRITANTACCAGSPQALAAAEWLEGEAHRGEAIASSRQHPGETADDFSPRRFAGKRPFIHDARQGGRVPGGDPAFPRTVSGS
ncbi:MAG: hypothetical protein MZV64_02615 [Ignavibacteriales bacterium]|nr:hypothetical protein [Ignavibacteriales bacterium]